VEAEVEAIDPIFRKRSRNIIGDVQESSSDEDMAVIGIHHNGHDISQSTDAQLQEGLQHLRVGRAMRIHAVQIKRNVRFVSVWC